MAPSVNSLFNPLKNTWILLRDINNRNSRKSITAFAFIWSCKVLILLQVFARVSLITYKGTWNGLTCFVRERESKRYTKYILFIFVYKTCILRVISECYGSSRTILEMNILVIRLSSIFNSYKYTSLYKVIVYIIL